MPLETLERLDLKWRPRDELLFHTELNTSIRVSYFHEKAWLPALKRLRGLYDLDFTPFTRSRWTGPDPEELLDRFDDAVGRLVEKRLTPYVLRHNGISWKLQEGVPLFVVSRDAGNESTSTTDRIYRHHDRKASESAARVIAGRLPRLRQSAERTAA
ncbi:hypothetical protein GFY24_14320 [Nocardia sp. SYP-A9097]|uniref:hypothetical protein n=1 Tax=Nocardia sp. SYP-A9097 TaxID=2663237 RepID=UPI00129B1219|nr:hypothetical protein [Nocardia sp. SYP-A9097]MRH88604.1 hypothetical protein [Nocardia sp. SYP-A9097]